MMLRGIRWMGKWTYLASSRFEHRYMLEMLPVQYLACGVDTILFQWVMIISIDAVCV